MYQDAQTFPATRTLPPLRPILRWAGSKKRQFQTLQKFFPSDFKSYVEPFAGSASFLFGIRPQRAVLNDINQDVISVYKFICSDTDQLHGRFMSIPRNKEAYYMARNEFNNKDPGLERSALFLYLNRNCFNGIYRVNKDGKFNVPFADRRVSPYLTDNEFRDAVDVVKAAQFHNKDFEEFCKSEIESDDFVFIDPPYYSSSIKIFNEYNKDPFDDRDFDRLVSVLDYINCKGAKFLLTYPNSPGMSQLTAKWRTKNFSVLRTIAGNPAKRIRDEEIIIANYDC